MLAEWRRREARRRWWWFRPLPVRAIGSAGDDDIDISSSCLLRDSFSSSKPLARCTIVFALWRVWCTYLCTYRPQVVFLGLFFHLSPKNSGQLWHESMWGGCAGSPFCSMGTHYSKVRGRGRGVQKSTDQWGGGWRFCESFTRTMLENHCSNAYNFSF